MAKVEGIIPNEELLGLIRSGCPMYNLSGVVKSDPNTSGYSGRKCWV